jgi:hypothetical protein
MTRCTHRNTFTAETEAGVFVRLPRRALILSRSCLMAAAVVLLIGGCRNTTSAPMGGAALSPLSPVQGTASLAPVQPSTGVTALGEPTRVPPPPTGSFGAGGQNPAAPSPYGPTSSWQQPAPAAFAATGLQPGGATLSSGGLTQGVTDLNPLRAPDGVPGGSSIRQTGWVADDAGQPSAAHPNVSAAGSVGTGTTPASHDATAPLRAGGMQPIDLTQSPYPPGYVPPQQRPGAASFPQSMPYPQAVQQAQASPAAAAAPLGQPTNWTTDRSQSATTQFGAGFHHDPNVQTAGRIGDGSLPSTEPFGGNRDAAGNAGSAEPLQWRRPSPRF